MRPCSLHPLHSPPSTRKKEGQADTCFCSWKVFSISSSFMLVFQMHFLLPICISLSFPSCSKVDGVAGPACSQLSPLLSFVYGIRLYHIGHALSLWYLIKKVEIEVGFDCHLCEGSFFLFNVFVNDFMSSMECKTGACSFGSRSRIF